MNDRLPPTLATIKILWSRCGNTCAKCRAAVTEDASSGGAIVVGEMCHIVAVKFGEARYSDSLSDEEKRQVANLIILCPRCHTLIDSDEGAYPAPFLTQLKLDHENWFMGMIRARMPEITFQELETITQHLLALPVNGDDYTLTPPLEKIRKNGLSNESAQLIRLGSAQSNLVKAYVEAHTTTGFDEKLRAGFIQKYSQLKSTGMSPDEIFVSMKDFATAQSTEVRMVAAGLAVVSYYFETCDIFEK